MLQLDAIGILAFPQSLTCSSWEAACAPLHGLHGLELLNLGVASILAPGAPLIFEVHGYEPQRVSSCPCDPLELQATSLRLSVRFRFSSCHGRECISAT